jgi:hypothetical protein
MSTEGREGGGVVGLEQTSDQMFSLESYDSLQFHRMIWKGEGEDKSDQRGGRSDWM